LERVDFWMKAVILAGGRGTRLQPFTNYVNKHLLPLLDKPIIQYGVETLKKAGVTDIAVVLGDFNCGDIVEFLGNGQDFGVNFTYYYQGEARGIAHAVFSAFPFYEKEEGFIVYLGDSIFSNGISSFVKSCKDYNPKFNLIFAPTDTPEKFGVPIIENYILMGIEEKPKQPSTNLSLTGCYYFNTQLILDAMDYLEPSARGEYELTDIINKIILSGEMPTIWNIYDGWWMDAGTFEGIQEIERRLKIESNK
jgi:glucose-1-phosphate thymidylyltransferase